MDSAPRKLAEEAVNAITHGFGVVASLAGGAVLITLAAVYGDAWRITGAAVFTGALVLLYSASTLYHAVPHESLKARLKVCDHCAIFILIAGTYTPFTLGDLRGGWGWTLFGMVWGIAVFGIVFKLFLTGRYERLSTFAYVAMGWIVLVAIAPTVRSLSTPTLLWLLAGGLAYTAGTYFYHHRGMPYAHAVWHVFVLAGSACHFAAVLEQVAPFGA